MPSSETTDPGYVDVLAPGVLGPGTRFGHYEIIELVGSGGMGTVYRARDIDLERPVAIKLVRRDRRRSSTSLLKEAQVMARLSHPNVVVVYEVGTMQAEVFVAMEFVEGETLRTWLSASPRSWREILAVFLAAARGIAAAHAAGIVHRDFKPDNVLVGRDGRVRVTDFGLAGEPSSHGGSGDDVDEIGSLDTVQFSDFVAGTPAYMSPEQHLGDLIDGRTDQHALAVSLYEALHGKRPFPGRSMVELRRQVLGHERPELPRTRQVPAWVNAVVARGFAREPSARYPDMDAFVAALENDPAVARRRVAFAAAAIAIAGVAVYGLARTPAAAVVCARAPEKLVGVWDTTVAAKVEQSFLASGRPYAADTFHRVAGALDERLKAWGDMRDDACQASLVKHEQTPATYELRMRCLDRNLGETGSLVRLFAGKSDGQLVDRAVFAVASLDPVARCGWVQTLTSVEPPPADRRPWVESLRVRIDLSRTLSATGRYAIARPIAEALVIEARVLGYSPVLAEALLRAAEIERAMGDSKSAQAHFGAAVEEAGRSGDGALEARAQSLLAYLVSYDLGRPEQALEMLPAARAALARMGGENRREQANILNNIGMVLVNAARFDEARTTLARGMELVDLAGDDEAPQMYSLQNSLAVALRRSGHREEALAILEKLRARWERALGPDHPWVAGATTNLCANESDLGRLDDAIRDCTHAMNLFTAAFGVDSIDVARAQTNLGQALFRAGRLDDSLTAERAALAIKEKKTGRDSRDLASTLINIAGVLHVQGKEDEALAIAQRALSIREKSLGGEHPDVAESLAQVAFIETRRGHAVRGREAAERGLAIIDKPGDALARQRPDLESAFAGAELAEGHGALALGLVDRAFDSLERLARGASDMDRARAYYTRGEANLLLGHTAEAVIDFQRAAETRAASSDVSLAEIRAAQDRASAKRPHARR